MTLDGLICTTLGRRRACRCICGGRLAGVCGAAPPVPAAAARCDTRTTAGFGCLLMCGWASLLAIFFVSALTRSWATGLKFYGLQRYSLKISFGQGGAGAQFRRQSGPPVQTWSSNPERPEKKNNIASFAVNTHARQTH